jgi:ATP-binding cassette subfamily F protein 3
MIQISGGVMRYGEKVLFQGLDWLITPQDRLGIVGANGTGKTTLLRILADIEHLDKGRIQRQKQLRIGYLPQDGLTLSGRSVFEECLSVFDEALSLEREQEELTAKMSEFDHQSEEYQAVIDRYEWVFDRYHALDGYTKEAQVGTVLGGLGFPKDDWARRTEEFSGGWQMRIALAKLLLEKPNLLLLDEPTNHLDLEARNWLEDYLNSYPYAFILISHDRYFLDTTVRKIIEIWNKQVHFYAGNYAKYESLKQQRLEQLEAAYKNQQDHIHHLEAFINRFRYQATKAAQVQSRVKELEKVERIELPKEEKAIHFQFPQPHASGRNIVEFQGVAKSYGPKRVLENVNFVVERGDRIALVGHNGAGKSTLIRMMAGTEPLTAGEMKLGHKVEIDYFAQDQYKELDPDAILFDDLSKQAPRMTITEVRGVLGCFLFSGDEVYKQVRVLSGGERNRYALARMLMQPHNFLLLDEPTNHLDLRAKDVLLQALLDFSGTVVFVSHDRYFIDRLATKVFAIGGGEIRVYPGNYEDFLWLSERKDAEKDGKDGQASGGRQAASGGVSEALQSALDAAKQEAPEKNGAAGPQRGKRINPIQAERLRERVAEVEEEIARLESETEQLQSKLEESFSNHERSAQIVQQMEDCKSRIEACEKEWEELTEKLEAGQ